MADINFLNRCPRYLHYALHPTNRNARDIIEHILANLVDLKVIVENTICDETSSYVFEAN